MELAYLNTNHPDFLDGSGAMCSRAGAAFLLRNAQAGAAANGHAAAMAQCAASSQRLGSHPFGPTGPHNDAGKSSDVVCDIMLFLKKKPKKQDTKLSAKFGKRSPWFFRVSLPLTVSIIRAITRRRDCRAGPNAISICTFISGINIVLLC